MTAFADTGAGQRALMEYQSRGWRVLPVDREKKPLVKWKEFTASMPSFTATWRAFTDKRCSGAAVALGASGLVCRDFDTFDSYAAFQARHPVEAAMFPTARTSRGYHVYARYIGEGKTAKLPDGEVRSGNAYTVLPPSVHASGHVYQWTIPLPPVGTELPTVPPSFFLGTEINWQAELHAMDTTTGSKERILTVKQYVPVSHPSTVSHVFDDVWTLHLPEKYGQRNACILKLVRGLKLHHRYRDIQDVEYLHDGFHRWYVAALPNMAEKSWHNNWAHFCRAWRLCRGGEGISSAVRKAATLAPLIPDNEALSRLANVCKVLSSRNNGKFFLSMLHASAIVGRAHPVCGTRAMQALRQRGLIKLVRRGKRPKASTWRWTGDTAVDAPAAEPPTAE